MGEYKFNMAKAMDTIEQMAMGGVNETLMEIGQMAIDLAPIRKQGRRKKRTTPLGGVRTKHEFPVGRSRSIAVTGGQFWQAYKSLPAYVRKDGTTETVTRAEFRKMRIHDRSANKTVVETAEYDERKGKSSTGKTRKILRASERGGGLRDGIKIIFAKNAQDGEITGSIVSTAKYSRFVEFPTHRTAAQPFLLPALKAARNRLKPNIKAAKGG